MKEVEALFWLLLLLLLTPFIWHKFEKKIKIQKKKANEYGLNPFRYLCGINFHAFWRITRAFIMANQIQQWVTVPLRIQTSHRPNHYAWMPCHINEINTNNHSSSLNYFNIVVKQGDYTRCFIKRTPYSFFHNSLKWWSIYRKFLPVVAEEILIQNILTKYDSWLKIIC